MSAAGDLLANTWPSKRATPDDPFFLLGQLLSPWSSGREVSRALTDIGPDATSWNPLLAYALQQWCTPFLYEQIRTYAKDDTVPKSVSDALKNHCLTNRIRNTLFQQTLLALLAEFHVHNIQILLLKGAATFVDDLYGCPGARAMVDIDLLVAKGDIPAAENILVQAGFEEVYDEGKEQEGVPTDNRHAHVNGYRRPGTPVVVELHYNVAYGRGGRILPPGTAWQQTKQLRLAGEVVFILQPTLRLLHNTVHGLIPTCDFIRGEIRFLHLVEFCFLAKKYEQEIDWSQWLRAAGGGGMERSFLAYLYLAHEVMGMPWPQEIQEYWWPWIHGKRLAMVGRQNARKVSRLSLSGAAYLLRLLFRLYYYCMLPGWVWQNVCYAEGLKNIPVRLRMLVKKSLSSRSRKKI